MAGSEGSRSSFMVLSALVVFALVGFGTNFFSAGAESASEGTPLYTEIAALQTRLMAVEKELAELRRHVGTGAESDGGGGLDASEQAVRQLERIADSTGQISDRWLREISDNIARIARRLESGS